MANFAVNILEKNESDFFEKFIQNFEYVTDWLLRLVEWLIVQTFKSYTFFSEDSRFTETKFLLELAASLNLVLVFRRGFGFECIRWNG